MVIQVMIDVFRILFLLILLFYTYDIIRKNKNKIMIESMIEYPIGYIIFFMIRVQEDTIPIN